MNRLGKCFSDSEDLITGEKWTALEGKDEKERAEIMGCDEGVPFGTSPCDPVIFLQIPQAGHYISKARCGIREHYINSMLLSNRVYGGIGGMTRYLYPYYKFPDLQLHIDQNGLDTLRKSNSWAFYILKMYNTRVATARQTYVSSIHDEVITIYTLLPLSDMEIEHFLNDPRGLDIGDEHIRTSLERQGNIVLNKSLSTTADIYEQIQYVNKQRNEDFKEMEEDYRDDLKHERDHNPNYIPPMEEIGGLRLIPMNMAQFLSEIQSYVSTTSDIITQIILVTHRNKNLTRKEFPIVGYNNKAELLVTIVKIFDADRPYGIALESSTGSKKYFSLYSSAAPNSRGAFKHNIFVHFIGNPVRRGHIYIDVDMYRSKFVVYLNRMGLTMHTGDYISVITPGGFRFKIYRRRDDNTDVFSLDGVITLSRASLEALFYTNIYNIEYVKLYMDRTLVDEFKIIQL